jgi:hypothetical protein
MPNSPAQAAELDRLDCALRSARALTKPLFRQVAESAGERFSILRRAGKTVLMDRFLEAEACTDAALALLAIELPNWKIRRLIFEGGEWRCWLSRRPNAPVELDNMAEASHEVLSLAILRALLDARRIDRTEAISSLVHVPQDLGLWFCCDNFA